MRQTERNLAFSHRQMVNASGELFSTSNPFHFSILNMMSDWKVHGAFSVIATFSLFFNRLRSPANLTR